MTMALKPDPEEPGTKVIRPWGWYASVDSGPGFQVKRIHVEPGQMLSLQLHHQRAEHWVVVSGTAEVTIGSLVRKLNPGEAEYIPVGVRHRLANNSPDATEIIEVQLGAYLGEDDIVRFDDAYGRS